MTRLGVSGVVHSGYWCKIMFDCSNGRRKVTDLVLACFGYHLFTGTSISGFINIRIEGILLFHPHYIHINYSLFCCSNKTYYVVHKYFILDFQTSEDVLVEICLFQTKIQFQKNIAKLFCFIEINIFHAYYSIHFPILFLLSLIMTMHNNFWFYLFLSCSYRDLWYRCTYDESP